MTTARSVSENRPWRIAKLGDVCEKITDGTHHSPPNGQKGDFKYITAKNIKPSGLDLTDITYVDTATHREIYSRCDVRKDDILYVKDGATTGRVALNTLEEEFSLLSSVGVLRPNREYVLPKYLLYVLQAPTVKDRMLADVAGVAITRLTLKKLKAAEIPLAPLEQQGYIIAELEKQFSRLDEAVANLKRVKANLTRYKAAVFNAAVEGRLVPSEAELARRESRSFESGPQLLERILVKRRNDWQGVGKYREPVTSGREKQPPMPEGWTLASIEQLNPAHRPCAYGVLQPGADTDSGVPFVRVGDIGGGKVAVGSLKRISPSIAARYPRTRLEGGELLITLVGAIGRTAIAPPVLRGANVARAVAVVPLVQEVEARWIEIWFRNPQKASEMNRLAHEVARKTLNLEDVRRADVAIPPFSEQVRIGAETERIISIVDEAEIETDKQLERARYLRDSILKRAFAMCSEEGTFS